MHKQKLWRNLSATTLAALLCLTPVANLYATESNEPAKVVGNEDKTSNNEEKTVEAPKADEQKQANKQKLLTKQMLAIKRRTTCLRSRANSFRQL